MTGFLVFYISLWHTFLQNPSLVVEDHKRYGTAYTSRKWGLSERYVQTIVSKARNNSLSLNNKHTNYSAEFKIKVAKAYAEGKHSFEEIAQLYGIIYGPT